MACKTLDFHFACAAHGIDDGRSYDVLAAGHVIHGVCGLHHYAWGPEDQVWLAWFAVDPDLHGQGWGASMLNHTMDRAQARGYRHCYIETYSSAEFEKARHFYRRQGFEQVGHIRDYMPGQVDMIVFHKDLLPS